MARELETKLEEILSSLDNSTAPWAQFLLKTAQSRNIDVSEWNTFVVKMAQVSENFSKLTEAISELKTALLASDIVQDAGASTDKVMSQNATTNFLAQKVDKDAILTDDGNLRGVDLRLLYSDSFISFNNSAKTMTIPEGTEFSSWHGEVYDDYSYSWDISDDVSMYAFVHDHVDGQFKFVFMVDAYNSSRYEVYFRVAVHNGDVIYCTISAPYMIDGVLSTSKRDMYRHDIELWIISRETDDCGGVVEVTKGTVRFTFTNSDPTPYNVNRGNLIPYDAINSYTGVATGFHTALSGGLAHIHLYKLSNNKTHVTMISPKNVYYDVTLDYSVPNFYIQDTVRKVTS